MFTFASGTNSDIERLNFTVRRGSPSIIDIQELCLELAISCRFARLAPHRIRSSIHPAAREIADDFSSSATDGVTETDINLTRREALVTMVTMVTVFSHVCGILTRRHALRLRGDDFPERG
jgi:hypothetical protein